MASSKKPLSNKVSATTPKKTKPLSLLDVVEKGFVSLSASHKKVKSMTVALSGGIDSVVLLHLIHQLQKTQNFTLKASHVHHGLSKNADKWVKFCERLCTKLSIPLEVHHIKLPQKKSLGIEGEARQLRYEKLLKSKSDLVVLAHHADDQAETFLLQLIRGAGVKGLSSMAHFDYSRRLWRPLLNTSRTEIESYAKKHQLKWIEDESNLNIDFDRNFIRSKVLPILKNRFNHIIKVISRSSTHLAEAQHLLDDLAKIDLKNCLKSGNYRQKIKVNTLDKLSNYRAKNVLRYWLELNHQLMPSKDLLDELLRQVLTAKKDAELKIQLSKDYEIRRYKDEIYIVRKDLKDQKNYEIIWKGESEILLPNGTQLNFKKIKGRGINFKHLNDQKLIIRNRQGGEFFKPDSKRPTKKIKQLLQESDLPPWERESLPLIFIGDELASVPNFGIDIKFQAKPKDFGLNVNFVSRI
ncbi:tRNA lysidine(34) synthetase TilS [Candidatus Methylopumilus universalis]|uniref:tRNA lysidine(34) synthetase TilS n=1 Tax=Candidatus Methylopumilus universalis TaxID=2588536 RepID=UPI00111EABBA|nr:tRNA lysidine(34) synthetase TilS [Candidatus Methylopumilus universalis]QDC80398.1 tRNA lysidine(34) synthetase TilS [Candidatus Methylopumilus universalis]QDC81699.1 tRNA lysidine(34) synthetase TilS [Candidatus Methylopumilus universalis]QDC88141.1 tRNA lysidine(34) synthetase TilS [Candidatus Methylopumilus universalis]QDC89438.1 tRNA lysidine(34) synthetase TilS [Candidatus Methylopumilus universalis]QDC90739.1 tRNA lysidine(34) synthetase TilS [Candidatus Methylopumilus universalis]